MLHGLQHEARYADLMQGQGDTQSSDAPTGNQNRSTIHKCESISAVDSVDDYATFSTSFTSPGC